MMQESETIPESEGQRISHNLNELLRFWMAVWHRRTIVLVSVAAGCLLGILHYSTATRMYASKASMLVMAVEPGGELTATSVAPESARQQLWMPTYAALITSAKVLDGAVQYLRQDDCPDLIDIPKERWGDVIRANLTTKTVKNTNIIEIFYQAKSPASTAAVVNAVVQSYVEFVDKTHKSNAGEVIRILTKEKAELAEKLAEKEQELQIVAAEVCDFGYGSENKVLHPMVQRAVAFNEALIETRKQRVKLESSLASLTAAVNGGGDLQQQFLNLADVLGKDVLLERFGFGSRDSATQANLEQSLFESRAKLRSLQEVLGPAHPLVEATGERIRMGEEFLRGYQDRISQRLSTMRDTHLGQTLIEMLQQQLQQTLTTEQTLVAQYEQAQSTANAISTRVARLDTIKHDLQWLRSLHDVLLNRLASIDLKHEAQDIRATVVSEPRKSETPVSPQLLMVMLPAFGGGLLFGLVVVYVADLLDDRFRSPEELRSQLGVPVLALVRDMEGREQTGLESLQVHVAPDAVESESFRTLRTALSLLAQQSRQVVVSSTEPQDGKTTVLANLAASYAQAGKNTILIDADLRRPGLTAMLELRGREGLSNILRGEGKVADAAAAAVWKSGLPGFDVIPAGPRLANPAELLSSPRVSELLAWAEANYDQVFVDSAPVLVGSDAALLGRLVDGVLLVVQPKKNRRRLVARVVESFALLKISLLGVVVNRVGPGSEGGYYYDGYHSQYAYERTDGEDGDSPKESGRRKMGVAAKKLQGGATRTVPIPSRANPRKPAAPRRVA